MDEIWKPHVTVAAIIERDGRFLVVEEEVSAGDRGLVVRYNQPAGHLDEGESLLAACRRETLEETAWHFEPEYLVGIYQWRPPERDLTYLRFAYGGKLLGHEEGRTLDRGILRALWLSPAELQSLHTQHRSPLVLRCVHDYLAGVRYPLELVRHYE